MKRTNRRIRVPIDLYPCHIEENMTIKEVKGESVLEWKTKVKTKDGIIIKLPGKFHGYKLAEEEEVKHGLNFASKPNPRTNPEPNPDIAIVIAQQLQNIIPQIVTQVTTNINNANGGGGNGGNNGCSYNTFTSCNPKEFDGKGCAIVLTRWIEKMESVFDNSGCTTD
ncbi:hypothetical protein Tco_0291622 [Tanacetum coccineum]